MSILEKYKSVRQHTDKICLPLNPEDTVVQIANFASPAKWHLGHTTWFFETFILMQWAEEYNPFDEHFQFIFNSYYNNLGPRLQRTHRGNLTRPTLEQVNQYRHYVDEAMQQMLADDPSHELLDMVTLGLHHEQQHQELLLTDIKYMFGNNPLFPAYDSKFNLSQSTNQEKGFVSIEEGIYEIGYTGQDFCYDNELSPHKVYLNPFEINKALVTNGEYIEFIEDGGYDNFNLWLEEGIHWKDNQGINSPLYWHKKEGEWWHYTLAGFKKVDPNSVLTHISFYEAAAYAEWKNMRLPTEFEWEIASEKFPWGTRWEWTNSAYLPYPNFKKADGAVGEYNGKFMDKQKVLRGASLATSPHHSRKTYRNFFYSEERWQFTGIRLVK